MPMKQDGIDTVTQSDNKMYDTKVYSDSRGKTFTPYILMTIEI